MPEAPSAAGLIQRVWGRLRLQSLARAMYLWGMVAVGVALLGVLAVRLLGVLPQVNQQPLWLLVIPGLTLLGAGIFHRRVQQASAARAIDEHARTDDLYLTLTSLPTAAGEYQPLVLQAAEQRAGRIDPQQVVPFQPWSRLGRLLLAGVVMGLVTWFTPQLDPFGRVEAAEEEERVRQEVAQIRQATQQRTEQLKKKSRHADQVAEEIDNKLTHLKKDLRQMQPKKMESNARVLQQHRSVLGDQWKARSSDQLRKMLSRPMSRQQMGGSRSARMNQWLDELQQGKSDSLQKELQKAQSAMQALMEAKDPEERRKLAAELKKDLQDLKKFASDKAGSKELAQALSQALKSLEAAQPKDGEESSDGEPMSDEAMQALKESMKLAEMELEQLAQSAEDMQKLNEALETLRKAQQLNGRGQLDGEKAEGMETMADYAELYAQMMSGEGEGNGLGGEGRGRGGVAPEDDSDPEGYKDEKTRTQIQQGKVLLSIKTKEHADDTDFDPDALRQYRSSVSALKQSVQSAIETEEIPIGYQEGIKQYFDKIEAVDPKLSDGPSP